MTRPTTLFYAPHVCSLACHIVLRELGLPTDLLRVDLRTKKTVRGDDFTVVHPNGYVPALLLDDGTLLTETAIILCYLADSHPDARLAPSPGGMDRVRFDELVHFIATELHKGFAPFTIMASPSEESKRWAASRLASRVAFIENRLGEQSYLHGESFTVLDAYAFWALRTYGTVTKTELSPRIRAYVDRIGARPSVRAALEAEAAR